MNMKALSGLLLAASLVVGVPAASAAPAAAAPHDCAPMYACTYNYQSFIAPKAHFMSYIYDYSQWEGYDNAASSLMNSGTQCTAYFYQYKGYSGDYSTLSFRAGWGSSDLSGEPAGTLGATWDNRISSARFCTE
jgi:hypothetical protein